MMNEILITVILLVIIQFLSYFWAYKNQSDKLTDLVYGGTFALLSLFLLFRSSLQVHQIVIAVLVAVWGIRLSAYLFLRINSMKKDIRFDEMRPSWVSYGKFWMLQTISILIIFLPVLFVLTSTSDQDPSLFFKLSTWFALFGVLIEVVADYQKSKFKSLVENKGKPMMTGLYKIIRFPNYLGEIIFWIGIYACSFEYLDSWQHIAVLSPLWISLLLVKISGIPLLHANQISAYKNNEQFMKYINKTAKLIPWLY